MGLRSFLFCDVCNPLAIRIPEQRRDNKKGRSHGRRWTDGRAWIEHDAGTAMEEFDWRQTDEGLHVCPQCWEQKDLERHSVPEKERRSLNGRSFIFCDCCNPSGVRIVETRRFRMRGDRSGRRVTDGRAWIEGGAENPTEDGWLTTKDGRHYCPKCRELHPELEIDAA